VRRRWHASEAIAFHPTATQLCEGVNRAQSGIAACRQIEAYPTALANSTAAQSNPNKVENQSELFISK
jgi:hypothetical protein